MREAGITAEKEEREQEGGMIDQEEQGWCGWIEDSSNSWSDGSAKER